MDAGDWGVLVLAAAAWAAFNVWNDRRVRYRCNARQGTWGLCREPVAGPGVRCPAHISRRHRSIGP